MNPSFLLIPAAGVLLFISAGVVTFFRLKRGLSPAFLGATPLPSGLMLVVGVLATGDALGSWKWITLLNGVGATLFGLAMLGRALAQQKAKDRAVSR